MADIESIFYKIGLKAKDSLGTAITDLKEADNTWTGTNDFEKAVTVSYADGTALDIKGTASTSDKLTAHSLSSTGDINAKGGITVTGDVTISKDLTVNGNLTISGAESVIDSDQLDITDNIFALSKGASGGIYAKDSGLYFERGSDKPASAFVFDESAESFVVGTLEGEVIPAGASNSDFTIEVSGAPDLTSIVITPTNVQGFNAAWPTTTTLYDNTTTYLSFIINSSTTYNDLVTAANNFSPHANTNYFANATAKVTLKAGVTGTDTLWATYGGAASTPSFTAGVTNPPSNSNGEIANTTPAPLTVGSLKLVGSTVTVVETLGTGVTSATFTTNASNQVTAIVVDGTEVKTYFAVGINYINTSTGLGGLKFTTDYKLDSTQGTNEINAVFSNGEIVKLSGSGGVTLVTYDFSTSSQELGDLADFDAGYAA